MNKKGIFETVFVLFFISLMAYVLSISFEMKAKDEPVEHEKELMYIEKYYSYGNFYFMFESVTDEKYYGVEVTAWEFDRLNINKDEIFKVQSRESNGNIEIFFMEEWTKLHDIRSYAKTR
ncbi:hypothetical protein ABD91_02020 [Lysinibacillus sphaericus]|uniref:hypothetical protein n=1 Tax=Lysinibacillus sphaericus TaxID=1421 RepID=UPI0018CCEB7B|nr:hypothetical protein [Lysinibacillus sphaericus]MBG9689699.1 hypothetical protein [Lysinibacillus sphaericus]